MNSIQIADETYVAADLPREVSATVRSTSWRRWWPDLTAGSPDRAGKESGGRDYRRPDRHHEVWLEPSMVGCCTISLHAEPTGVAAWQLAG